MTVPSAAFGIHNAAPSAGERPAVPLVVAFSGADPSGGAGVQADIEALASMGCHAAPVVTAITVQDTRGVHRVEPCTPQLVAEQTRALFADMKVSGFKIGLLSTVALVECVHALVAEYPQVPVILDPVLRSGTGKALLDADTRRALISLLFDSVTVLTPNTLEARELCGLSGIDDCGRRLTEFGCEYVLVTGTHEETDVVVNRLYDEGGLRATFSWDRLVHSYHGSGCTLASALAGLLAQGVEPARAIQQAQEYTWESLKHGYPLGGGQWLPNRLYWAHPDAVPL